VQKIGLAEAIEGLRAELAEAMEKGAGSPVRFQAKQVTLAFHVGVTRNEGDDARLDFWIVELSKAAGYATETIQQLSITLLPVDAEGDVIRLSGEGL
jgi:Trypsin-co-occurring domain 2